ncbi:MAG: transcriptional regulator NrdR [Thermaerobacter sp.]|nr:transcriptional regulator NrdR [Thermaerobacter sp.]
MNCPFCRHDDTRVLDSRPTEEGSAIRRRRECAMCERRFTTYERVEEPPLLVVKKDGRREAFDRQKILRGMITACEKRPVALAQLESLASGVERYIRDQGVDEVPSHLVGERVMDLLAALDTVAYVRFASVYRDFTDLRGFKELLERMDPRSSEE